MEPGPLNFRPPEPILGLAAGAAGKGNPEVKGESWICEEAFCQRLIGDYLGRETSVLEMPRWSLILYWKRAESKRLLGPGQWEELLRAVDRAEEIGN